ncbi:hypothetical protein PanWU01x14_022720 [Parasponia andersonii]|uniref:Uncharacterized protein n=1 Tax=Parasponia andersonii TaxID=3476 RepID=A0A2P5DXA4_PARAD|nr:hypothetical protein PanWU01x14_022720 [Parasponia andersonii]
MMKFLNALFAKKKKQLELQGRNQQHTNTCGINNIQTLAILSSDKEYMINARTSNYQYQGATKTKLTVHSLIEASMEPIGTSSTLATTSSEINPQDKLTPKMIPLTKAVKYENPQVIFFVKAAKA